MQRQPPDPRYPLVPTEPTWQSIIAAYAVAAAFPVLVWVVSNPLTGVVSLTATAALIVGARRAEKLVRCFYECQGISFELGRSVRVTVTQPPIDDPN